MECLHAETILRLPAKVANLTLDNLSGAQCLQFFPQTPNLTSFDFSICLSDRVPYANPPLTVLQQLHTAKLHADQTGLYGVVGEILDRITAPALKTLDLLVGNLGGLRGSWPMASFSSFLARSSCTLTRLRLGESVMFPRDFLECLRLLPSIIELQLINLRLADTHFVTNKSDIPVWKRLVYLPGRQNNLLPNLEYLRVHVFNSPRDEIFYVIRSRWWSDEDDELDIIDRPSRLKMCRLGQRVGFKEEAFLQVEALQDEGLDIELESSRDVYVLKLWIIRRVLTYMLSFVVKWTGTRISEAFSRFLSWHLPSTRPTLSPCFEVLRAAVVIFFQQSKGLFLQAVVSSWVLTLDNYPLVVLALIMSAMFVDRCHGSRYDILYTSSSPGSSEESTKCDKPRL